MTTPVRLLHITDTHLFAEAGRTLRGVDTRNSLQRVLEAARTGTGWPPDAMLATGDISEDETPASYQAFRALTVPLGVPVHCLPGNHDDPDLMQQVLDTAPLSMQPLVRLERWLLVLLNSGVPGHQGGRLDDGQLALLQQALTGHRDRHVLVCVHHQPVAMGSRWLDRHRIANADALFACLARHRHVRGVLWGHVHQTFDEVRDGLRLLATPATCGQFLPGSGTFTTDDRPPAWRQLILHGDGRLDTEVQWLQP